MQITVLQAIFIGIWSMLAIAGTLLGNYSAVPLIYATGVGVVLAIGGPNGFNDNILKNAIIVGAAGQIVWLGFGISQGGIRPPDPIAPGVFAPVLAIVQKTDSNGVTTLLNVTDAGVYIGYSIAVGILMQLIVTSLFTAMSPLSNLARKAVLADRLWLFKIYSSLTLMALMLLTFIFGLIVGLSANGLAEAAANIPNWLRTGLRVTGGLLPALGFALILKVMLKKEYVGFAFLGFFLAIVFQAVAVATKTRFSVVGVAIAALAFILIILAVKKLAGIKDPPKMAPVSRVIKPAANANEEETEITMVANNQQGGLDDGI